MRPARRQLVPKQVPQRDHLRRMTGLALGTGRGPADARSLARMHLRELGRKIEATLNDKEQKLDDTTRAHLEESGERIAKVLGASVQVGEP